MNCCKKNNWQWLGFWGTLYPSHISSQKSQLQWMQNPRWLLCLMINQWPPKSKASPIPQFFSSFHLVTPNNRTMHPHMLQPGCASSLKNPLLHTPTLDGQLKTMHHFLSFLFVLVYLLPQTREPTIAPSNTTMSIQHGTMGSLDTMRWGRRWPACGERGGKAAGG